MRYVLHQDGRTWKGNDIPPSFGRMEQRYEDIWVSEDGRAAAEETHDPAYQEATVPVRSNDQFALDCAFGTAGPHYVTPHEAEAFRKGVRLR